MEGWILQRKGYELGNFITMTPLLRGLAKREGKVNVFFENPYVGNLFYDCPFIKHLDHDPGYRPRFQTTILKERKQVESDYEAYCRLGEVDINDNDPYVDSCDYEAVMNLPSNCVAVFHGCLGEALKNKKDLGDKWRQGVIDKLLKDGKLPVILGSQKDWEWFWCNLNLTGALTFIGEISIRKSIAYLRQCQSFVSNDTGLMHVAAALKIPGVVYWKDTKFLKNKPPFKGITHIDWYSNKEKL